jgi:hypothetical protein
MKVHRAAIYHFTDGSEIRPKVYLKELERIKTFASGLGHPNADVYVDKSLRKCDQVKLGELMGNIDSYEVLILKDFYHLRKNTGAFISDLVSLIQKKIEMYTIEDGNFSFIPAPFDKPLKVAIYYCGLEITGHSLELQYDIMDLFIKTKTLWTVIDRYADLSGHRIDGNQKELQRLILNKEKYDVLLVQSLGNIHWRTSKFSKIRHQIQRDIYSMHEDIYLGYEQEVSPYDK